MVIGIKKAQSWSIDVTLGILVFIAAFFVFYSLLNPDSNTKISSLKQEASSVIKQIGSQDFSLRVVDSNVINESKLNELKGLSYDELKSTLSVEGDLCIYLEDDRGNIVLINNSYKGIGASSINLSGTPCSQK